MFATISLCVCCAHEGETGTNESAKCWLEKTEKVPNPAFSRCWMLAAGFTIKCVSHAATNTQSITTSNFSHKMNALIALNVSQPMLHRRKKNLKQSWLAAFWKIRSKTHERLKERLLIRQNGIKRANFRGSPLFQATYNNKKQKTNNSTYLVSVGTPCWTTVQ